MKYKRYYLLGCIFLVFILAIIFVIVFTQFGQSTLENTAASSAPYTPNENWSLFEESEDKENELMSSTENTTTEFELKGLSCIWNPALPKGYTWDAIELDGSIFINLVKTTQGFTELQSSYKFIPVDKYTGGEYLYKDRNYYVQEFLYHEDIPKLAIAGV